MYKNFILSVFALFIVIFSFSVQAKETTEIGTYPTAQIAIVEVSPNDTYQLAYQLKQKIDFLKSYFGIDEIAQFEEFKGELYPRHIFAKCYEIAFKLNILREKYGLPFNAVAPQEPRMNIPILYNYGQLRRILTEVELFKFAFNIQEPENQPLTIDGEKTTTEVFNLLTNISYQLNLLNGASFVPSHPFAQAMRISDDVDALLRALEIKNPTIPPPFEENIKPADVFATTLELLEEVIRVQKIANFGEIVEANTFKLNSHRAITPTEVFGLATIVVAELQSLKAHLGLKRTLTPIAKHYEGMIPGDVKRVMGWSLRKMKLIQSLSN